MYKAVACAVFVIYCVTQAAAWPQDINSRTGGLSQRSAYIPDDSYIRQRQQQIPSRPYTPTLRYHQRRSHTGTLVDPPVQDTDASTFMRRVGTQSEPPSREASTLLRRVEPELVAEEAGYQSDQSTQDVGLTNGRRAPIGVHSTQHTSDAVQMVASRRPGDGQADGRQRQGNGGRLVEPEFQITVGNNQWPAATQEAKVTGGGVNVTINVVEATSISNAEKLFLRLMNETLPSVRDNVTRDDAPSSRRVGGQTAERTGAGWNMPDSIGPIKQLRTRTKFPGDTGSIVFPGQGTGVGSSRPNFKPRIQADGGPACAGGQTFCDDLAEGYPAEYLSNKLQSEAVIYRELFGKDIIPPSSDISQRIDVTSEDQTLCLSNERIIYPKVGQNRDDQWLFIVNHADYQQGVRIEQCMNEDGACQFSANFALGYTTFCKQKYILRKMLALDGQGDPMPDSFKLPSCCVCHVRSPGAELRMMVDPAPQTPAPKSRRTASTAGGRRK